MRSRTGVTATTQPDKRNGYAMDATRVRQTAGKPLFPERFARVRGERCAIGLVAEWDAFIQIRKARRGNCW
jgi:hypothetical protein